MLPIKVFCILSTIVLITLIYVAIGDITTRAVKGSILLVVGAVAIWYILNTDSTINVVSEKVSLNEIKELVATSMPATS